MLGAASAIGLQGSTRASNHDALPEIQTRVKPAAASREQTVQSNDKGQISGKVVVAESQKPGAGAAVWINDIPPYYTDSTMKRWTTTADAQGGFVLEGLPPGDYRVAADLGNLTSRQETFGGEKITVVPDKGVNGIVLRLQPGIALRIKVVAAADAKPIAGARVHNHIFDAPPDNVTDSKGEVLLEALPRSDLRFEATAPGFATGGTRIELAKEQPEFREIRLAPGGSISGHVRDEQGKDLANVRVQVNVNSGQWGPLTAGRDAYASYIDRCRGTISHRPFAIQSEPTPGDHTTGLSPKDHGLSYSRR